MLLRMLDKGQNIRYDRCIKFPIVTVGCFADRDAYPREPYFFTHLLLVCQSSFFVGMTAAAIRCCNVPASPTVVTPFPDPRLLKAAQKRSSSGCVLKTFLCGVKPLLLLMIGFAFALPVLRSTTGGSWLSRTRRDVAIVIDASYSMNYELDRGKVFAVCKDAAVSIVNGLFAGDRVCVYVAADTPIPVIEKPTTEHATVVQAIQALACQHGSSKLDEVVALALRTLEQQDGATRVYILTDGQPWPGRDSVMPPRRIPRAVTHGSASRASNATRCPSSPCWPAPCSLITPAPPMSRSRPP
jgi:hypothetical protein